MTHVPVWGVMLIMEEAIHGWGWKTYWKCLYFPLNFAVNLKLLLKKMKSLKKKIRQRWLLFCVAVLLPKQRLEKEGTALKPETRKKRWI